MKNISSLQSKNTHGCVEISLKMLKINAPFISFPLNFIYNTSKLRGVFHLHFIYSHLKITV